MQKIVLVILATALTANAGVTKFSAKHIATPAAKATVKAAKVAGKSAVTVVKVSKNVLY